MNESATIVPVRDMLREMAASGALRGSMRGILDATQSRHGVDFAEMRFLDSEIERLRIRDGAAEFLGSHRESGVGVRVLIAGAWGFACTSRLSEASLATAMAEATRIAKASARGDANACALRAKNR